MKKLLAVSVIATATAASMQAQAFKFETPRDWDVRFDNTVKGNLMLRVENQDPSIYDPTRARSGNGDVSAVIAGISDDATYSVDKGDFASQRIDLLSELDVVWKDRFGFRISGAGWYDFAYDNSDAATSGSTKGFPDYNSTFAYVTAEPGEYNDGAKDQHYRGGELLDAFVFANFQVKDAAVNVRLGRHTLVWGQALLATGSTHGFAGSMAALDLSKGLGTPGTDAKELYIPNNKISSTVQLGNWSLSGYYAFEFEPVRWPSTGTYFATNELAAEHSECLTLAAGTATTPRTCVRAVDYNYKNSGDWGLNLKYYIENWDLEASLIYLNNTDRFTSGAFGTQQVTQDEIDEAARADATIFARYGWVFKDDIDTFGISLSKQMWDISWGADFVYRNNNALYLETTASLLDFYPTIDSVNPGNHYPGPTGDTLHVVVNGVGFLDGEWGLWDGGAWAVEVALSNLLNYNEFEERANILIENNKWNSNVSARFKPTWYQVYPGWDLSMPASISYTVTGKQAPNTAGGNKNVGNGSFGFELDVEQTWLVSLAYNFYYGPQKRGPAAWIKDRDNVSLTVKRTF